MMLIFVIASALLLGVGAIFYFLSNSNSWIDGNGEVVYEHGASRYRSHPDLMYSVYKKNRIDDDAYIIKARGPAGENLTDLAREFNGPNNDQLGLNWNARTPSLNHLPSLVAHLADGSVFVLRRDVET